MLKSKTRSKIAFEDKPEDMKTTNTSYSLPHEYQIATANMGTNIVSNAGQMGINPGYNTNTNITLPLNSQYTYCGTCGATILIGTTHVCNSGIGNSGFTNPAPLPANDDFNTKMESMEASIVRLEMIMTRILDALGILSVPIEYP